MKKNTANRQLVPKYFFLSDFDILYFFFLCGQNFIEFKLRYIYFKINLNMARNFGLYTVWDKFGGSLVGLLG